MQRDIIVVENFYKDPDAVVEYAKTLPYYYPYQNKQLIDNGSIKPIWTTTKFTNFNDCPFRSSHELVEKLESIVGEKIDRQYWDRNLRLSKPEDIQSFYDEFVTEKIEYIQSFKSSSKESSANSFEASLWNGAFQTKLVSDQSEAIHNHINDYWQCCGELGWAGVLYLSPNADYSAGTKFWKNKTGNNDEWMTNHNNWDLVDTVGNVYNRLVLFRGNIPHSGSPGFGDSIKDGRLFQTFFFRTIEPGCLSPVEINLP